VAKQVKIGVAQIGSTRADPESNVALICSLIEQASENACSLVVFPECCLTGYVYSSRAEVEAASLSADAPQIQKVREAAERHGVHVIVGFFEKEASRLYNTALLLGPEGWIGRYRKRHLPYLGGDRFVDRPEDVEPAVFDTPVGRIGVAICYEIRFPEVVRTLVLAGAELVALPTNWPSASTILAEHFTRVRAAENFVYFLAANRNDIEDGTQFLGASQIVDPIGDIVAHAGSDTGLFYAEADLSRTRDKRIVFASGEFEISPFADRRPDSYRLT
jgi:predicted amidohydrolase